MRIANPFNKIPDRVRLVLYCCLPLYWVYVSCVQFVRNHPDWFAKLGSVFIVYAIVSVAIHIRLYQAAETGKSTLTVLFVLETFLLAWGTIQSGYGDVMVNLWFNNPPPCSKALNCPH